MSLADLRRKTEILAQAGFVQAPTPAGPHVRMKRCLLRKRTMWAVVDDDRVLDSGESETDEEASAAANEALRAQRAPAATSRVAARWAYGVTTVPERRKTYLPKTLASLKRAGFDKPMLFVDGEKDAESWRKEFGLEVSARWPRMLTRANWYVSFTELFFRDRLATHFAMFQDDVLVVSDLKQYLSSVELPAKGYFNLFTMDAPRQAELPSKAGWFASNQKGRGAIALMFTRQAAFTLLTGQHMVDQFQDGHRGDRNVDGGILDTFAKAGWTEYVHNPSLAYHIGDVTSMGSKKHSNASSFPGESARIHDELNVAELDVSG